MEFAEQLGIVVVFCGLIVALAWWLRRGRPLSFRDPNGRVRQLESIERLPLTPQHSLHLVRLADRRLLIGISPSGCSLLDADAASTFARDMGRELQR